ncbi:12015_t:CDS:2 [Funneliformis geosporum]|uniref:Carbonic anhydrase n=1 Tax=Funneliformis geosporum TaxID=1117311 RepID=A0A9W4X0I1_9GLOM|nr:8824_t:CDS:2 [Funneliformis geosporum]CAI2193552.1 12015_t:CDS:2 [Funneliformis geosporum]
MEQTLTPKSEKRLTRTRSEVREMIDDNVTSVSKSSDSELILPVPITFSEIEENLQRLLDSNKAWAKSITETKPEFFTTMAQAQHPKIVWFGCSDSRVPAETVVQLGPGEIFVHRNIANQFNHADLNSLSVLQYAVDHLKVEHIIVCGHYGCGGVLAAMSNNQHGLVDNWLRNIKDVYWINKSTIESSEPEKRADKLVELNVKQQVYNIAATSIVQSAWADGRKLEIHGWSYRLDNGILNDLEVDIKGEQDLSDHIYKVYCRNHHIHGSHAHGHNHEHGHRHA